MYSPITARECEFGETKCADNYQCIQKDRVCDGFTNCNDESDEETRACKGTADIFLQLMYNYTCYFFKCKSLCLSIYT